MSKYRSKGDLEVMRSVAVGSIKSSNVALVIIPTMVDEVTCDIQITSLGLEAHDADCWHEILRMVGDRIEEWKKEEHGE